MDYNDNVLNSFSEQKELEYKEEKYLVRDNGAIFRLSKGTKPRNLDGYWTFGKKNANGYMMIGSQRVHIIVANAFLGFRDSKIYVVDHIDTNRSNNRVTNLRWLTRLENILLNDITRHKIEYICGSVEAFLENPSILRGHESEDRNFEWMRTVSEEEAQNTLKNWRNLFAKEPDREFVAKDNKDQIGEWVFEPQTEGDTKPSLVDFLNKQGISAPRKSQEEIEEERQRIVAEKAEKKRLREEKKKVNEEKRKAKEFENKQKLVSAIKDTCKENSWAIEENVKVENFDIDFLLDNGSSKIAIQISEHDREYQIKFDTLAKVGIRLYWLTRFPSYGEALPSFCISYRKKKPTVSINEDTEIGIDDFLCFAMNGKIMLEDPIKFNAIKVRFIPDRCFWCGHIHFIYDVLELYSTTEIFNNHQFDTLLNFSEFDQVIVSSIKLYLSAHSDLEYNMGEIKERYSRTMNREYMSFGCPKCDGLVGGFYAHEHSIDYLYAKDDEFVHRIELIEDGLKLKRNKWVIRNWNTKEDV